MLRIVDDLDRRGVGLIMLSMGGQRIDTRAPTGKLMVTMLGVISEFGRGLLLERQREGVAKAWLDGKYKGRKLMALAKAAEVIRLDAEGLQRTEIARRTGIGVASVYRVLAGARTEANNQKAAACSDGFANCSRRTRSGHSLTIQRAAGVNHLRRPNTVLHFSPMRIVPLW